MLRSAATIALACALALGLAAPGAASAGAPDPGGDPDASLAAPPAGKELGFNDGFKAEGLGIAAVADLTMRVGGNAARMPMQWWDLEPQRGVWAEWMWAQYELVYAQLTATGIRPHFSITHAPPWARDAADRDCTARARCNYPPGRDQLDRWERFTRELATRFPQAAFGIWNEPNYLGSWRSGVDPERYAELLARAHSAIKSTSPAASVLGASLGTSEQADGLDFRAFLDRAYAAEPSIKRSMDAIEVHIYPTADLGPNSFFAHVFKHLRDVRAAHGDAGTPFHVTEVGASTTGTTAFDDVEQGDLLMRVTRKLLTMPDVSGVLVHRLVESQSWPADHVETGLGVLRGSPLGGGIEPKRAYCALSRAGSGLHELCPPETRIDAGPPNLSRASDVSFAFSSPDPVSGYECALNDASFTPCSSPVEQGGLAEGTHTFRVRARDLGGRLDPHPPKRTFTLDRTPPKTEIDGPSGPSRVTNPSYTLSASKPGVSFECSLNGSPFASCADPYRPGPLLEGTHSVAARATDAAGNVDPTPATRELVVDLTPPETTITAEPPRFANDSSPVLEFESNEPGSTFRCGVNTWALEPCTSPHVIGPLPDGDHGFRVQATDAAGNQDQGLAWVNFTVDTTRPVAWFTAGPSGPTSEPRPSFRFAVDDPMASAECRFGQAPFEPCAEPRLHRPAKPLPDGAHTLDVRARDRAGNLSTAVRRAFTVYTEPPDPPRISAMAGLRRGDTVASRDLWFAVEPSGAGASAVCYVPGFLSFTPCADRQRLEGLPDGSHQLSAWTVDPAGNRSDPAVWRFDVDLSAAPPPPGLRRLSPPRKRRVRFRLVSSDPTLRFRCRVNRGRVRACGSPVVRRLKPRRHVLRVWALNGDGVRSAQPRVRQFRVRR